MADDLKIVIVAEHASEKFGGEAILPVHYFRHLIARGVDVRLVTHSRTKEELRRLFPHDFHRIYFVPDTRFHKACSNYSRLLPARVALFTLGWMSHLLTQLLEKRLVKKIVAKHGIDIVHEPIPVSPKLPSLMYNVGAPVIIGPMNGGMNFPNAFRSRQSSLERITIAFGRASSTLANVLIPGKKKARLLLVANERTKLSLQKSLQKKAVYLPENGVQVEDWPLRDSASTDKEPVKFIFAGRLIGIKAVDILLRAFKPVTMQQDVSLTIVGDGPEKKKLQNMCLELKIQEKVAFTGWLSQSQYAQVLARSDVIVFPSLHDCGGAAVLEAMACGLPVIAANWGGPADYLTPECGTLINVHGEDSFVQNLTNAMQKLAAEKELREQFGKKASERVVTIFSWSKKIDEIITIYRKIVDQERTIHSYAEEANH